MSEETVNKSEEPKETILTWRIENAHLCWQKPGEELISPTFTIDWLNESSWHLCLYPRGIQEVDDYASYFIVQERKSDTENNTGAKFELYFLAADGSKVLPENSEGFLSMSKNNMFGYPRFFHWCTLIGDDESHYLPNETLTLCCRIWRESYDKMKEPVKLKAFARTRIRKEDVVLRMPIHIDEEKCDIGELRQILREQPIAKFIAKSYTASNPKRLTIDIAIDEENDELNKKIKSSWFEFVLVSEDKKTLFWKKKYTWDDIREVNSIELSTGVSKFSEMYVPMETFSEECLYLACRFAFTTGSITQKLEKGDYGNNLDIFFEQRLSDSTNVKQEQPCQTASDALKSLYYNPLFYDAIIKGKTAEFKVHEMILSPRSEVFKKLLSERDPTTKLVKIGDDDDTLQRVIYFLYTDTILDMHWEIAKRLYKAAYKYKIELMKEKCRAYIKKNISKSNVSDVVVLIKDVKDEELKEFIKCFITRKGPDVFNTVEWSIFSKFNPVLAGEYMLNKYKTLP